ncbi:Hypothetical predicted protein [Mytilus galloprovincialis]|uniref:Uncharacterized protein n=1 Tax=Mytilus galloprovincialis TaxID=29158 RepID=A0A8B6EMA9_MYTGA|nr:Hypothetical predicted protein [Mytilus galloprovincialis]
MTSTASKKNNQDYVVPGGATQHMQAGWALQVQQPQNQFKWQTFLNFIYRYAMSTANGQTVMLDSSIFQYRYFLYQHCPTAQTGANSFTTSEWRHDNTKRDSTDICLHNNKCATIKFSSNNNNQIYRNHKLTKILPSNKSPIRSGY